VGGDQVKALADRAGISEDQAASVLAGALPQVADEVSPGGRLPDSAGVDDAMRKPRRKRAKRADDVGGRPPERTAKRGDEAGRRQREKTAKRGGDAGRRQRRRGAKR
jgi:hypothetical protein